MINLTCISRLKSPITADCISPDIFRGKTKEEIEKLKVWEGNKQKNLCELFRIDETKMKSLCESPIITVNGNVSRVRRIGSNMKGGEIIINGHAGMHLGEEMKGGKITARGNVASWAGAMMKGGTIEIYGNAGDYLGAPYRGCSEGMHGGKITVHGNIGAEGGAYMRKGLIRIDGNAGQFLGFRMHDGTIYVQRDCGARAGACMTGGKIVVKGLMESVLPTFTVDTVKSKVKIEEDESAEGPFYAFLGDLAEKGKGKLYVSKEKNPHLTQSEQLL